MCFLARKSKAENILHTPSEKSLFPFAGTSTTIQLSKSPATLYNRIGEDICGRSPDETREIPGLNNRMSKERPGEELKPRNSPLENDNMSLN